VFWAKDLVVVFALAVAVASTIAAEQQQPHKQPQGPSATIGPQDD
jgi:hypothetical protein